MSRKIIVYSTRGGTKEIQTDATTWGELKTLVQEYYDLSNLQATENKNKTTLEHEDAVLPEGEFILFLRNVRTKSGAFLSGEETYQDLRDMLNEDIKLYLNKNTLKSNWTNLSHYELARGIENYFNDLESQPERDTISDRAVLYALRITKALIDGAIEEFESGSATQKNDSIKEEFEKLNDGFV